MNHNRKRWVPKAGDIIAFLAFIVSVFSICFGVYQYKDQKKASQDSDKEAEDRFNKQFAQIRTTDSLQILNNQQNLINSKRHFDLQFSELKFNDSVQRTIALTNALISERNFLKQFSEIHTNDSIQRNFTIFNIKNSVKPLLQVIRSATSTMESSFGIEVINEGFGPAIIDSCTVYFDGQKGDLTTFADFAQRKNLLCWKGEFGYTDISKSVMQQGKTTWILAIPGDQVDSSSSFFKLLNCITVRIKYHSLTDDKYEVFH